MYVFDANDQFLGNDWKTFPKPHNPMQYLETFIGITETHRKERRTTTKKKNEKSLLKENHTGCVIAYCCHKANDL